MPTHGWRRRALARAAAALALAACVASCTDGGAAAPTSTPSVTASATPAPTPSPTPDPTPDVTTPPVRPAAMGTPDSDGAAAAASYFMALYPYVLATGDLAEWNAMSADTCDFCVNTRAEVERLQSAGERSIGGATIVSASGQDLRGSNDWYAARLTVEILPSADVDVDGTVVRTNDGGTYDVDFAMTWTDRWVIDSAGIVEAPTD